MRGGIRVGLKAVFPIALMALAVGRIEQSGGTERPALLAPHLGGYVSYQSHENAIRADSVQIGEANRFATNEPAADIVTGYEIPWNSINGGGVPSASAHYRTNASVGQSVSGEAGGVSYRTGVGYWYGIATGTSCSCPHQGDLDGSGFIDVTDVLRVIGIAFVNGPDVHDPGCPKTRGDVNNNGVVDVNDVLYIIRTAFTNSPPPVNPCP